MRIWVVIANCIFLTFSQAQIVFDKTTHDYGQLSAQDDRFVDIYLKNTGADAAYLLSVKKPMEVVYLHSGSLILPGESNVVRLQVNPTKKGRFNYEIPIYTSDRQEPTMVRLKGELLDISQRNNPGFTQCPSFNQRPKGGNPLDFQLTVETIDAETKQKLEKSTVTILQNGRAIGKHATASNGQFSTQIPLGISYFYAVKNGYYPAEVGQYVNFKSNYVVLELYKKEVEEELAQTKTTTLEQREIELIEENEVEEESIQERLRQLLRPTQEVKKDTVVVDDIPSKEKESSFVELASLSPDDFRSDLFKPINVVFVIDVSSSMNQADRMELMKYALIELVDMIRPQDKIGLVAYANTARVLLPPTAGSNKQEITDMVQGLKASGLTAGGEGIKLGYKQARKNFLPDGFNQVIIITDGAFNKNSGNYQRDIKRFLKRGITLSVVGIKNNERSAESMSEAANLGEGQFIEIQQLVDAQNNLKQLIRQGAFKYK